MRIASPHPPPGAATNVLAMVVLATLFGGALVLAPSAWNAVHQTTAASHGWQPWVNGRWTADFTEAFNAHWPGREWAVGVWGAIDTVVFGQGRPGVAIGKNEYLFTTEEFAAEQPAEVLHETIANVLTEARTRVGPSGAVVLAVIPDKSRVCSQHIGRVGRPDSLASRYDDLRAVAVAAGAHAPDLRPALDCAAHPGAYLRTDTHWSPEGAERVANVLAAALPGARGAAVFDVRMGEPFDHLGDLVPFLALGPFVDTLGPTPDRVSSRTVTLRPQDGLSAASLFGDEAIPMVLVGTSFSAESKWGFADALKLAFQMDVVNRADPGQGPVVPMQRWLADAPDESPSVVIWEFPERYLQTISMREEPNALQLD